MEKVKEAANPSALAVLTVMLFWGQVQNYMMRANLRKGNVSFGPSLYSPGGIIRLKIPFLPVAGGSLYGYNADFVPQHVADEP